MNDYKNKYEIKEDLIPIRQRSPGRRSGKKRDGTVFIVAHDTGNDGSTARNNVNYFKNSAFDMSASAHAFIDDKEIIVCVPLDEQAFHVMYNSPVDNQMYGHESNDFAIGIELCYGTKWDTKRNIEAYNKYIWFIARLLNEYNLDVNKVVGHYTLDPKRRTDPLNAFQYCGITWNTFIKDLGKELEKFKALPNTFKDVPTNHMFYEYVEKVNEMGLMSGYGNELFGVDDNLTRGQLAAVMARFIEQLGK